VNTAIFLSNSSERLYLSPMFNHLFLSDAKKSVIYDFDSGSVRKVLHYPK